MQSITWFRFRVATIALAMGAILLMPGESLEELRSLSPQMLTFFVFFGVVSLLFVPLMLLLVIGTQAVNPYSAPQWLKPTHDANPFYLRNPLLFFHFGAYLVFAAAIALLISSLWRGWPALAHGLYLLLMTPMMLAGIRLCIWAFPHKLSDRGGVATGSGQQVVDIPPEQP